MKYLINKIDGMYGVIPTKGSNTVHLEHLVGDTNSKNKFYDNDSIELIGSLTGKNGKSFDNHPDQRHFLVMKFDDIGKTKMSFVQDKMGNYSVVLLATDALGNTAFKLVMNYDDIKLCSPLYSIHKNLFEDLLFPLYKKTMNPEEYKALYVIYSLQYSEYLKSEK